LIFVLGDCDLLDIHPFEIRKAVEAIYPTQSGSTRNRQGVTPIRAVMSHAYDRGWAPLMRFPKFKENAPRKAKPATVVWLHCFVTQAERDGLPHLAALVTFMSTTGARVSEAVALLWPDIDLTARTALLRKTKTTTNSVRHLTDEMISRIHGLRRKNDHVFKYTSRFSVNEAIKRVCRRAGISYKSSHLCGRHSFGTNSIAMGADVKTVMEAGDWKSVEVFMGRYVNPRHSGRKVAELFNLQAYETGL
jgi:integrase